MFTAQFLQNGEASGAVGEERKLKELAVGWQLDRGILPGDLDLRSRDCRAHFLELLIIGRLL